MTSEAHFPHVSLAEVARRLKGARRVLIISHTNPDGDTLGSAAALAGVARALGCEVVSTTPDKPAARLEFLLDESYREYVAGLEEGFDLICAVDVASPEQLGSLSHLAEGRKIDFMLDHHAEGNPFAPNYVDPTAAAASEIVYELYRIAQEIYETPNLPDVSRNVYAALISDTGSFKYSNVTPHTHIVASELVYEINSSDDGGMTTEEIARTLFGRRTMTDLKAQGLAISKLSVHKDGELGVVLITTDDMKASGVEESDLGAAVETPRSLEGVKIALALKQSMADPNVYRVSSRSNCEVNVADVCALFGGGGHAKAAGCKITAASPEEALETAVKTFGAALS